MLYLTLGATLFSIILSLFLTPIQKHQLRWIFGFFTVLFFISLGYYNCQWFETRNSFSTFNKKGLFLVEVLSLPNETSNAYKCEVKLIRKFEDSLENNVYGNAVLYLQKENDLPSFFIGDYLLVNTQFKAVEKPQNPNEFNFSKYLERKGFLATGYVPTNQWKKTNLPPRKSILRSANLSRNHLLEIYKKYGINGREFALLAAITLGYKDEIEVETKNNFSRSGASHILAISGLHIGIVYGILMFLFGFWKGNQKQKIIKAILVTLLIWIFAFITGLSPAVQRATIMMSFIAGATCLRRKPQIFNTVFSSAFVMLLFNPNLLFNIGFQLSYSAVLSIIYFQPKLNQLITIKNRILNWFWLLLTVTISAQIGIFPLIIYYFQQFPNYFIITNFITIPLTTTILYLSIILISISYIPFISVFIAFLLKLCLKLMLLSVGYIADFPASVTPIGITNVQFILLYIFIFITTIFFNRKKGNYLIYSLFSLLLIISISAKNKYESLTKNQLIVFSNPKVPIINILEKGNNYVLTTDSSKVIRNSRKFWLTNHHSKPQFYDFIKADKKFFSIQDKKIMIISDNELNNKQTFQPIQIDYLIITNKAKPKIKSILQCIQPITIVVDRSISEWYKNSIKKECEKKNIGFYSVKERGAFRVEIQ